MQLMLLLHKLLPINKVTMMKIPTVMMIPMVPSSSSSSSRSSNLILATTTSSSISLEGGDDDARTGGEGEEHIDTTTTSTTATATTTTTTTSTKGIQRDDEPNLYNIPNDVYPIYRSVPWFVKLVIGFGSISLTTINAYKKHLVSVSATTTTSTITLTSWLYSSFILPILLVIKQKEIKFLISFIKLLLSLVLRTALISFITTFIVQDLFWKPSRLSISTLLNKYYLPSKLSNFDVIPLVSSSVTDTTTTTTIQNLGVHYIKYENNNDNNDQMIYVKQQKLNDIDAVYVNHGFGASSLSWLPALPSLVRLCKAKVGIGHDAVGFGFTDRPIKLGKKHRQQRTTSTTLTASTTTTTYATTSTANSTIIMTTEQQLKRSTGDPNNKMKQKRKRMKKNNYDYLYWYTFPSSAKIGTSLLQKYIQQKKQDRDSNTKTKSNNKVSNTATSSSSGSGSVALFGHSMGCITTLHMALNLPKETTKYIILTAPALGMKPGSTATRRNPKQQVGVLQSIKNITINPLRSILKTILLDPTFMYILRRVVGMKSSWKRGLQLAWGDANRLTGSDVLRFQWPSIGFGWERGLVNFASAQQQPTSMSDYELFQRVYDMDNTYIAIIYGTKDNVIPPQIIHTFFHSFLNKNEVEDSQTYYNVERSRTKKNYLPIIALDGLGHDPFEEDTDKYLETVNVLLHKWDAMNRE